MIAHDSWPVDPAVMAPFLAAVLLTELTPGPNMTWLAVLAMNQGRAAGFAAVAGVTLALSVYMLAAAFGVAELFARFPAAYEVLRWAGVLFLLWLAWEMAFRPAAATRGPPAGHEREWRAFRRGMIANLLNPKAALFYVVMLPTFMQPGHAPPFGQALLLGTTHILVSVGVHGGIVIGADRLGASARLDRESIRWASGATLMAIAFWLALQAR